MPRTFILPTRAVATALLVLYFTNIGIVPAAMPVLAKTLQKGSQESSDAEL